MTRWLDPQSVNADSLASLDLHPLVAQTLVRRGFTTPDSALSFLDPLHATPTPASALPSMDAAVQRITSAISGHESICVWGDFDVDGQTSTTLLVQTLQLLGANVTYHIPIRGKEGHGVHVESLKPIVDNGAKLIITCDTGITAYDAVDYAKSRRVDVIITDHHDLGEALPGAIAIINPKLLVGDHPLANLAGVGVAYKLAEALLIENRESDIKNLLDLVALGLIADVALLKGETRTLAQKGIQAMRVTGRLGLQLIAEFSEANLATLTEETIGFTFAPRLNALGRLGDANPAVELLLTQDPARARVLSAQIEGLNAQRRLLTSQVYEAAEAQLHDDPALLAEPAIVLTHPNWPGGVVGIVANKLVERYHKPALLLTESDDGVLRGSARSVEGLHIIEAIATQKDILLGFGGHPMAAGLSLPKDKLAEFEKGFGKAVERQLGEAASAEPTLQIDTWLALNELTLELATALDSMSPFGAGNPILVMATRSVQVKAATTVGRAKEHVRLTIEDESGNTQNMIWWGHAGDELPEQGSKIDVAYSLRTTTFRGEKQIAVQCREYRLVEARPIEISRREVEVIDLRLKVDSFRRLAVQTFVEGNDKGRIEGADRYGLRPSEELAIFTTPPGPAELRAILDQVKPRKVYLIAQNPQAETTQDFLTRLAGMAKHVILQRGGKVTVQELAAKTTQREATIRLGLEWLAAGGHLLVKNGEDNLHLSTGTGQANPYSQRELFVAVTGSLEETAAYRLHFVRADSEMVLDI